MTAEAISVIAACVGRRLWKVNAYIGCNMARCMLRPSITGYRVDAGADRVLEGMIRSLTL